MERYDNIEYSFESEKAPPADTAVQFTEKDGFITSQQYVRESSDMGESEGMSERIPAEKAPKKRKDKNSQREIVTVLQLSVCIVIALAAFIIKNIGGDIYNNVKKMYYDNLNNSVIIDFEKDSNDQPIREIIDELYTEKD